MIKDNGLEQNLYSSVQLRKLAAQLEELSQNREVTKEEFIKALAPFWVTQEGNLNKYLTELREDIIVESYPSNLDRRYDNFDMSADYYIGTAIGNHLRYQFPDLPKEFMKPLIDKKIEAIKNKEELKDKIIERVKEDWETEKEEIFLKLHGNKTPAREVHYD